MSSYTSTEPLASGNSGDSRVVRRTDVARPAHPMQDDQNVGQMERLVGGVAGLALAYLGLKRMSLGGLVTAGLGAGLIYRSTTGYCPAYGVLGINRAQNSAARPEEYFQRGVHVDQSFVIERPIEEVYGYWRDFTRLPTFMKHLQKVETLSPTRSRWTATGPLGTSVSWEAEIIHDLPNDKIAWKSVENSAIANAGTVTFRRKDNGTEVRAVIDYIPPAGAVGKYLAQFFGEEPSQTVREDLRRFKLMMEGGRQA